MNVKTEYRQQQINLIYDRYPEFIHSLTQTALTYHYTLAVKLFLHHPATIIQLIP